MNCFKTTVRLSLLYAVLLPPSAADDRADFFERRVRPLLIEKCVGCHGAKKQEGNLRLDSRSQVLTGTSEQPALAVPGKPDDSRLLQVLRYNDNDVQMPPKGKLSKEEIAAVEHWIRDGAFWPESTNFGNAAAVESNAWKRHWAFQPVVDHTVPSQDANQHPIDAFIRSKLNEQQVAPNPQADASTLVRRLSYALTGLPPHVDAPNAIANLNVANEATEGLNDYADRLLASAQFGERWARYWLDIARYSDTKGYLFTQDREYKDAWRFREWVIKSLNDDMPYDEFLRRQIAADQLPGSDDPAQLAAMGFLTLGRRFLGNQHDIIDDRIDVLSRGTMALTVSCARCHDHKFDPIPTADYYSLYGVFASSHEPNNDPSPLRLVDKPQPQEPVVFLRGNPGSHGEKVPRRFLTALSRQQSSSFSNGSGRLELAEKIAAAENPLTARVAVNRIWMRLFGSGLVDSPSDFGVRTPPPSHPELLDHLAAWFVNHNWSRKQLIQYIVTSETWRQSSAARPELEQIDPDNRLLSHMPRRRLDFEAFRDSVLSVSGVLDSTVGGKSADIITQPFTNRRTIYARIDRQNLPGTFRTFDFASPDTHAPKRFETTVPQQALFGLNSPFIMQHAEKIAGNDSSPDETATAIFRRILHREPNASEHENAVTFLMQSAAASNEGNRAATWMYGYGEISLDRSRLLGFTEFPSFNDGRWGGGAALPDPKLGWSFLTKEGGHAGNDLKHATIRRWIAPAAGRLSVTSAAKHKTAEGDGVRFHFCHNDQPILSQHLHNNSRELSMDEIAVRADDTISFVVDCHGNYSHDSFEWQITVKLSTNSGKVRMSKSAENFSGGNKAGLSPTAQLAQILLLSNEFMFVD